MACFAYKVDVKTEVPGAQKIINAWARDYTTHELIDMEFLYVVKGHYERAEWARKAIERKSENGKIESFSAD